MNVFSVTGNLGKDSVLRKTQAGKSVLGFSIADSIGWGDKKRTQWIECSIWGERADKLAEYLKKGMSVTAWGELEMTEYESKDGSKKSSLKLNVSQIAMQSKASQPSSQGGFGADDDPTQDAETPPF